VTKIASSVRFLPREAKAEIAAASPVPIYDRLAELRAFQAWMGTVAHSKPSPAVVSKISLTAASLASFAAVSKSTGMAIPRR
jgi:hypothetical protein